MITNADIVCGLSWGDEAKGKVVSSLVSGGDYAWVCRWSGGSNAGHTIYENGKKYVTHIVPAGIFHNVKCYIGPECYVNIDDLIEELNYLKTSGFDTSLVKISERVHLVTNNHKEEDIAKYSVKQGSTSKGIAPCARDKYGRTGSSLISNLYLMKLLDEYPNIILSSSNLYGNILCEGAQGFWLDINHGNYPYVTSSLTLPYSACSLGFPPQKIGKIYGCCKLYDTRVGVDPSFPEVNDKDLLKISDIGNEVGSTTGRTRRVNWLDLNKLIKAVNISGTTQLIISKTDVIKKLGKFKYYFGNTLEGFSNYDDMINNLTNILQKKCPLLNEIKLSSSKFNI